MSKWCSLMFGMVLLLSKAHAADVSAFPGAEGFGAVSQGGRGGKVMFVTNLNNSGTGSFRAACEASGPRIVVFKVGGIIHLTDIIRIKSPYLTIAGQTAPGDGICIRNAGISIRTHDVIIRGLRIRIGDDRNGPGSSERDGINLSTGDVYNVIIDHCSLTWGVDENIGSWGPLKNLTVQWSIISEGLYQSIHSEGNHSMGFLLGAGAKDVSIHHNIFAHNTDRNPFIQGNTRTEIINNVVYNWKWTRAGTNISDTPEDPGALYCDVIGNFYQHGIDTASDSRGINLYDKSSMAGTKLYVKGNISPFRPDDTGDEWLCVSGNTKYRSTTRVANSGTVTVDPVLNALESVLAKAGAVSPVRDSIDERIVRSVKDKTGRIINSPRDVGGFPSYQNGTSPKDSDSDGMPDEWEIARSLNPNNGADSSQLAPSGYTWVEEYINGLFSTTGTIPSDPEPKEPIDIVTALPFNFMNTAVTSKMTLEKEVQLTNAEKVQVHITSYDVDSLSEILFQINGQTVSLPQEVIRSNGTSDASLLLEPSLFKEGLNSFSFQYLTGDGFMVEGLDVTVIQKIIPPQPGSGFIASYFQGTNFDQLMYRQVDSAIDFNWGNNGPIGISSDNFSIKWEGSIIADKTGKYTFTTETDDGVRLWVNGNLVIDQWKRQAPTQYKADVTLEAGSTVPVIMEYCEETGGALARLNWQFTGVSEVPEPPPVTEGSFLGSYYRGVNFDTLVFTRNEPSVNYDWGGNGPEGLPADYFSVKWTGTFTPQTSGNYAFTVRADDGVRLWINDKLLIDQWKRQPATTYIAETNLSAGVPFSVKLEYFENTGNAVMQFSWKASTNTTPTPPPVSEDSFLGSYYRGTNFETFAFNKNHSAINFEWGNNAPEGLPADYYSARWTRSFTPEVSGNYTFTVKADDGVRLWVNNIPLIDQWKRQAATTYKAQTNLTAGIPVNIKLEYFENTGAAIMQFFWEPPTPNVPVPVEIQNNYPLDFMGKAVGTRIGVEKILEVSPEDTVKLQITSFDIDALEETKMFLNGKEIALPSGIIGATLTGEVVLNGSLFENGVNQLIFEFASNLGGTTQGFRINQVNWTVNENVTPVPSGPGYQAYYYNGIDFNSLVKTQNDSEINFNWGSNAPSGMNADGFSVRWTGNITPEVSGEYSFFTETDDGVRLWVNNQLIIDKWVRQPATKYEGKISLEKGIPAAIKMEYYEDTGNASAKMYWQSPQIIEPGVNVSPVINSISYDDLITHPRSGTVLVINANDANGDDIRYRFEGDGTVSQTEKTNEFIWTPGFENGVYTLEVFASDDVYSVSKIISVEVNSELPLDFRNVPLQTRMTLEREISVKDVNKVQLQVRTSGIENLREMKMYLNEVEIPLPSDLPLNAEMSLEVDPQLFMEGKNLITFEYAEAISNATPGFVVESFKWITEPVAGPVMAFPGAEGYGAFSKGGRGGKVFQVTNLNNSGPGSLREALEAVGPRIIIFKIGGIIHLTDVIKIRNPYVTIAGQTAPGDGICIRNAGISIRTHDVVIRGMRIRIGDDRNGPNSSDRDGINLVNMSDVYNIIIDHCSISWGIDENIGSWGDMKDMTIQWSIISEGLYRSIHDEGNHSMGFLLGAGAKNVSIHHNLFAHNTDRNPFIQGNTKTEIINNVVYNWKWSLAGTNISDTPENPGPLYCDAIGNYYKGGRDTESGSRGISLRDRSTMSGSKLYVQGNLSDTRTNLNSDEWACVSGNTKYRSNSRVADSGCVTIQPVTEALESVLSRAGAIAPVRDSVDQRVVNSVKNRSGGIIDSPSDVGGWPSYKQGEATLDSDQDGIPDSWETQNGLDSSDAEDANQTAPSGYSWIEEYINSYIS